MNPPKYPQKNNMKLNGKENNNNYRSRLSSS